MFLEITKIEFKKLLIHPFEMLLGLIFPLFVSIVFYYVYKEININYFFYLIAAQILSRSTPAICRDVDEHIKTGRMTYFFTKPVDFYLFYFSQNFLKYLFVDIISIAIIFSLLNFKFNFLILIFASFQALLFYFIFYSFISLFSFFTEESKTVRWIFGKISMVFSLVPIDLYPSFLKKVSKVFPNYYFVYLPSKIIVSGKLQGLANYFLYFLTIFLLFLLLRKKAYSRMISVGI